MAAHAITVSDRVVGAAGACAVLLLALWGYPVSAEAGGHVMVAASAVAVVGYAGFGAFALVLARGDLRSHTLPNGLVLIATLWTCGLLTVGGLLRGDGWNALLLWAVAAGAALTAGMLWRCSASAIGGGDVKLVWVAVYAGLWPGGSAQWVPGLLLFGVLLAGALLIAGLTALARGRREFSAGPLLLIASSTTAVLLSGAVD